MKRKAAMVKVDATKLPRGDAFEVSASRLVAQVMREHYGVDVSAGGEVPIEVAVLVAAAVLRSSAGSAANEIRNRLLRAEAGHQKATRRLALMVRKMRAVLESAGGDDE